MWSWPVLDESLLEQAGELKYVGHLDVGQRGAKAELAAAFQSVAHAPAFPRSC